MGVATIQGERSTLVVWAAAAATAVVVGTLALAADFLPSIGGRVLLVVASTGLSWAGASAILGAWSPRPLSAAVSGFLVLVGAVVTYYGEITLFASRGGGPEAWRSTGLVWGSIAAFAGPALGALGWFARHGTRVQSAIAWGAAGGSLMSQGVYLLTTLLEVGIRESGAGATLLVFVLLFVPFGLVVLGARKASLSLALMTMLVVGISGGIAWAEVIDLI